MASLPFGIAVAYVSGALPLSRPDAGRRARPPAAGHAAGRHRLSRCCCFSAAAGRSAAFLEEAFGIVFAFRWTGAALACGDHGLPAAGARDPPVDRGGRPRGSKRPPRRSAPSRVWVFVTITLPLILPGHPRRHGALPSPAPSASSARPSPSSPTFPARRRPCRPRSTPTRRCPAASCRRSAPDRDRGRHRLRRAPRLRAAGAAQCHGACSAR